MVSRASPVLKGLCRQLFNAFLVISYFTGAVLPIHTLKAQFTESLTLQYSDPNGGNPESFQWANPADNLDDFFDALAGFDRKASPGLSLSEESANLVYNRARQIIAEKFGKRFEAGTLALKAGVFVDSKRDYLPQLQTLFERNGRQKIIVEVPNHAVLGEMVPAINQDLERAGWGRFVEYKVNPVLGNVGLEEVFPGKQTQSNAAWNKTRSLLVPIISVAGAYLGVMAEHVFNNPKFQALQGGLIQVGMAGEKITEIEAAMRLGPVFLGTIASVVAALGVKQLSLGAQKALSNGKVTFLNELLAPAGKFINQHSVIGVAAATTLVGTGAVVGSPVVATLIQIGFLMSAAYGLEFQFSKYSPFWDKYFWRVGWVDWFYSKNLIPTKLFNTLKASPKLTGFMTNWGVNTLYPFSLFVSLAAGSALATVLTYSVSALGGPYLGDPFAYGKIIEGALKNGFFFSTAFGLFQVLLGGLKEKGFITEALRFKLETIAVTYNQSGRVLDAGGVGAGSTMQIIFSLAVTLPTAFLILTQRRIQNFIDNRSHDRFIKSIRCDLALAKVAAQ